MPIFGESGKRWKLTTQRDKLPAIKWCDAQDVYLLSTAQDDWKAETSKLRGAHKRTKPNTLMNYNTYVTGVDKSNQMLSYC